MINKKTVLLILFVGIFVGYEFSAMYVPDDFERPFFFRLKFLTVKLAGKLSKLAGKYNIGTHASNFRNFLRYLTGAIKSNDKFVNITDTKMNNVPVRIYKPKMINTNKLPFMVFLHGGGYTFGDLETYDKYLIQISKQLNMFIVSVELVFLITGLLANSSSFQTLFKNPYPYPTNDCFAVIRYILKNSNELGVDLNRFILAGDSAGGNAAAVITQALVKENNTVPKLQILIYPWLQMFTFHLPSLMRYSGSGLLGATQIELIDFVSWYLGFQVVTEEMENNLLANNHTLLLKDEKIKRTIQSYLDINLIPQKYKEGKSYYQEIDKIYLYPNYELDEKNILNSNQTYGQMLKITFDPTVSPLFADEKDLIGIPKTYFVITEWDALKDEGLLYSERLRKAGVDVQVAFYEKGFHGIVSLIDHFIGYDLARNMLDDLINFLKSNI